MRTIITLIITIMTILSGQILYAQGKVSRAIKSGNNKISTQKTIKKQTKPKTNPNKALTINVSEPDGYINGHGYIDLGLPSGTKWAICNVGALSPDDYGDYFAWGEIKPRSYYKDFDFLTHGKDKTKLESMGIIDKNDKLLSKYDAAFSNCGDSWKIPTKEECVELKDFCIWSRIGEGKYAGYKIVGPNGKSIFLPAAGYRNGENIFSSVDYGFYWTSTINEDRGIGTYYISFDKNSYDVEWYYRMYGYTIRAVSK